MMRDLEIPENAFANWPLFEQRLRERIEASLDPEAVARVMFRTQRAYAALQLPSLIGSLESAPAARLLRYESWHKDYQTAQAKMLEVLIDSFVALEA